ncbi:class I SAM-dependent methyltransferase [Salinibius halmophilus]|uniref:class I SAM-dependent methyltransferase n=1 Tax=Salinibius halmophilus TaxID=1853216 RepID=UPI000E65EE74|nr:class I SAM-dependent methyltransferase [Salinibius halmophilus]
MPNWTNEHAKQYDELWGDLPLLAEIANWLPLQGNERLLDIGCGSGAVLAGIAERYPQCTLFGCDPMPYMVDAARKRVPSADIQQATVEDFQLAPFDVAIAANTVRHWANVERGLEHIAKHGVQTIVLVDDLAFNPSPSEFCPAISSALRWFAEQSWQVEIQYQEAFDESVIIARLKP